MNVLESALARLARLDVLDHSAIRLADADGWTGIGGSKGCRPSTP